MKIENKIAQSIISCQIALHHLEELKHTPLYSHKLKNQINRLIRELIKREELFDAVEKEGEKPLHDCVNIYFELIKRVSKIEINEIPEILEKF